MRRLVRWVGAATALGVTWVHAASVFEFGVWMHAIDQRSVSVQKHIARHDREAASADARELERLYRAMEAYFQTHYPAPDAAEISRDGWMLAADIPASLQRQDFAAAAKAARALARACNDCHDLHKPFK